jgi:type IV pilus assembly protein PilW
MKLGEQGRRCSERGFSLVELLVGLLIGLLVMLVVLQVFAVYEGQKRTTTGSSDAQTNGNVALFMIKRDLSLAGYGLLPVTDSALECTAPNYADSGVTSLSPVTITDGGTGPGASDTITIRYGTSNYAGSFTQITAPIGTAPGINGGTTATVNDNQNCAVNDVAIVINGSISCNLTKVAGLSTPPDYTGIALTNVSSIGSGNGYNLACLGAWKEITYGINPNYNPVDPNNSQAYLQRTDTTAFPVVGDIVNVQAQYGISSAASSNQITQWVDATGSWAEPLSAANRNLIKAVRVAVVARNGLMEKTNVTSPCSSLSSDAPTGLCAWAGTSAGTTILSPAPAIDLSNDPNWQRYRYRVFETIIPLRNVIWSKSTL